MADVQPHPGMIYNHLRIRSSYMYVHPQQLADNNGLPLVSIAPHGGPYIHCQSGTSQHNTSTIIPGIHILLRKTQGYRHGRSRGCTTPVVTLNNVRTFIYVQYIYEHSTQLGRCLRSGNFGETRDAVVYLDDSIADCRTDILLQCVQHSNDNETLPSRYRSGFTAVTSEPLGSYVEG